MKRLEQRLVGGHKPGRLTFAIAVLGLGSQLVSLGVVAGPDGEFEFGGVNRHGLLGFAVEHVDGDGLGLLVPGDLGVVLVVSEFDQ